MKKLIVLMLSVLLLGSVAFAEDVVPQSQSQMQMSFAPLVKKTSPAVVNIYAKRLVRQQMRTISPFFNDPFFGQFFNAPGFGGRVQERIENSLGSGVIVDEAGYIATNTHVVKGATEINVVTADGREFDAEKVLIDEKTDLAVLRIKGAKEKFPYLELMDSDELEVGDIVLAIGNPFGVGQTVTSGIISGLSRTGVATRGYGLFIQTDAAINPGNSGGALVDMQGRLIGINSMIYSKDGGSLGIGFAIPANMVKTVVYASRHGGKLVRPWTGMGGQTVTHDMLEGLGLKRAQGSLINRVSPKGPAARAGIRTGDVILSIDGKEVQDAEALKFRLATVPVGSKVRMTVWRNGKIISISMRTEAPPEIPPRDETLIKDLTPLSGLIVANISPAVLEEINGLMVEDGVVVMEVQKGNAAVVGIAQSDVILAVNGKKVQSVKELLKLLAAEKNPHWEIKIQRGSRIIDLRITL